MKQHHEWLKPKGYLHITPDLDLKGNDTKWVYKIQSPSYVARYAFFPLLYREIRHRRYRKPPDLPEKNRKQQDSKHQKKLPVKKNEKVRPIHYATHLDAHIFSYYAHILNERYIEQLKKDPRLDSSIIAYRKIPVSKTETAGKSNIHFAKEVFDEIKSQGEKSETVAVLTLDLKNFFSSLSHEYLYESWARILGKDRLPPDHENVFQACTRFSYILYDDLRQYRNGPLDEARLARIRKEKGFRSFFGSHEEFRKEIREGNLRIYKNSFRHLNEDGTKEMAGIPQGLPISAVLSNIYLLEFDKKIIAAREKRNILFYRRYSDDIIILCPPDQISSIREYISVLIKKYKIDISKEKTEEFLFRNTVYNLAGNTRLTSILMRKDRCVIDAPLTYLGLEYRGYQTLIKSSNLTKYYRRLIYLIKRRARRAQRLTEHNPHIPNAVYINQLKKLYNQPLRKHQRNSESKHHRRSGYRLVINDRGDFEFEFFPRSGRTSNFISYVHRCDRIFGTKDFSRQLRKTDQIIAQAIKRHLKKQDDR